MSEKRKAAVKKHPPALTPEGRDSMMASLAADLAEKQLREGTATSQLIVHYLKLDSSRERLELERLKHENELLKAKTEAIRSSAEQDELYKKAIEAMQTYSGHGSEEEYDD